MTLDNSTILITGGTGSLGNALIEEINKFFKPHKVIIYSRNEYNQHIMAGKYKNIPWLRFRIGDIRDAERINTCCKNVDYVIHAAALKHIRICEENPLEAIKTNINGSTNIIESCIKNEVKKALLISTDKSPQAKNLYGSTKFVAERLFIAANIYGKTKFNLIRYGNVLNSHGSVVEHFLKLKERGIHEFPITHAECSRFWITLEQAAQAVITALMMDDNPIIIPKLPSMKITDLAKAIDPDCTFRFIGLQPGEKIHEMLCDGYTSDKNTWWLTPEDIKKMLHPQLISA